MRCPKCHYLSFEPEVRCRNCGFDLSIGEADLASVPFAPSEPSRPMVLGAIHAEPENPLDRPFATVATVETRWASSPLRAEPSARASATATAELPLFVLGLTSAEPDRDAPVLKVPTAFAPLAVRRRTADSGGTKAKYGRPSAPSRKTAPVDRDLLEDLDRADTSSLSSLSDLRPRVTPAAEPNQQQAEPVGAVKRLAAAVVDGLLLGGINAAVVWFTLRQCGLTASGVGTLPVVPLAAFLLLVDVGYLLMFTVASGQTVGKMVTGIRVVGASPEAAGGDRVTFRQAALRELLSFPSVLALGAGFVPALVGEGLAVHDRIAHTRVVRA